MIAERKGFFEYLDSHQDDIKYARWGYIMKLSEGFKKETGIELSYSKVRRLLRDYRIDRKFQLQYAPHTYYHPVVDRKFPNRANPYSS